MTAEFELMMRLMLAASTGKSMELPQKQVDWSRVLLLARQQQILPLVCRAAEDMHLENCPSVLPMVLSHCARMGSVIALLEEMNAFGIPCRVVKGFAAGIHYAAPEYRPSGDTDILLAPSDEARACAFLSQHGFSVRSRWAHGHHAVATHPKMGIIEVHVRLYDELIGELWFDATDEESLLREPAQSISTPDGTYQTLGATDHAIYMALHMVKHFILSGNSLRMMTDLALALLDQAMPVDMARFWQTMERLHYGALVRSVLWALVLYGGFKAEDFPGIGTCDSECVRLILDDLEAGGWLGREQANERAACWHEYNRQMLAEKRGRHHYKMYMLRWKHAFGIATLLPGREQLAPNYPWVLRHPVLMPLAWGHRLLVRGGALLFKGLKGFKGWQRKCAARTQSVSTVEKKRLDLFRRLKMIE